MTRRPPSSMASFPLSTGQWLSVVSACPPSVKCPRDLATLCPVADMIELRLDLLKPKAEPGEWIAASARPVLVTLRSAAEGGTFEGSTDEAVQILTTWVRAGAIAVDLETDMEANWPRDLDVAVQRLPSIHGKASDVAFGAANAWRKMAIAVETSSDLDLTVSVARKCSSLFVVPTGTLASTRAVFVGPHRPGLLFGAADTSSLAVKHQPTLSRLLDELRAGEVSLDAALFGLVGNPPAWSPSPAMHNAVFRARNLDALYVPLPSMTLDQALKLPIRGWSVTHPWKQEAFARADEVDEFGTKAKAVNTLVRRPTGELLGLNTDVVAIQHCLEQAGVVGGVARVYGSGGYARAAIVALKSRGVEVKLTARHSAKGRALAKELDCSWAGTQFEMEDESILVNATPLGADGQTPHSLLSGALAGKIIFDAPYTLAGDDTAISKRARADQAKAVFDGRRLLLEQARGQARAFLDVLGETFQGLSQPALEVPLKWALSPPQNLVLLGPRGVGKSTVGKLVARALGRPFLDLDGEIAQVTGRSSGSWISNLGEPAFRQVEHEVLARRVARRGVVIACGSGVVEHLPNESLIESSLVVFLDAPPNVTGKRVASDTVHRPRLYGAADAMDEATQLEERRRKRWVDWSNHVVDATSSIDDVCDRVVSTWLTMGEM